MPKVCLVLFQQSRTFTSLLLENLSKVQDTDEGSDIVQGPGSALMIYKGPWQIKDVRRGSQTWMHTSISWDGEEMAPDSQPLGSLHWLIDLEQDPGVWWGLKIPQGTQGWNLQFQPLA